MSKNRTPKRRKLNAAYGLNFQNLEPRRLLSVTQGSSWPNLSADHEFTSAERVQENFVRDYLETRNDTDHLQGDRSNLRLVEVEHGLASTTTRFQQTYDGLPIFGAFVTVNQGPNGEFQQVFDQGYENLQTVEQIGAHVSAEMAESSAMDHADAFLTFSPTRGEKVWYVGDNNTATQAWQLTVYTYDRIGDFLTVVSANDGNVEFQENRAAFATGSGLAYDPNPFQTIGGGLAGPDGGLEDNNDQANVLLNSARVNVTLEGLDDGTGLIKGEFVDLSTLNSPTLPDVDADEPTRIYNYDRDDERFEQVNVYYAVDSVQRYIHTLGFDDDSGPTMNGIRDFATLANAHWTGLDESLYSTADDAILFGDGNVDNAEDADIVVHEYGHAIQHDQNAAWGGGEMDAMGEGFANYLAASFHFEKGNQVHQADHAAAVGEWDQVEISPFEPPFFSRVDGLKQYPDDLTGDPHEDGEIWSAALWDLREIFGPRDIETVILESHFGLPANATMPDGALQILLADVNLNGGANQLAIRQVFEDRGILEPIPTSGKVTLDNEFYTVEDTVEITVNDANGIDPVIVTLETTSGDIETITLPNTGLIGTYLASIDTVEDGTPVPEDGFLQVILGDEITATYNDPDDGSGNPITDTAEARVANIMRYDSTDTPVDIEDNTDVFSTINVPDEGIVADVMVLLNITHTWDSDLDVFLTSPDGTEVELFTDVGGSGDNFTNTFLRDDADASIIQGTAPFEGNFRPEGELSDFDFQEITGDWVLRVGDDAIGDEGTIDDWSLFIDVRPLGAGSVEFDQTAYAAGDTLNILVDDPNAVGPVDVEVTAASGDVEVVTLTDNGDGTHSGSIVTATGAPAADGTLQVRVQDSVEVSYFDADDGTGSSFTRLDDAAIENRIEYPSTDVPVSILDQTSVFSTIEITDGGTIADLDVSLDITHTWDADLNLFLTSPAGTTVELFTDVGGSGDNFTGTIIDDEAETLITAGSAPFTGRFSPEGFLGDFDTESITGTWTLEIFDDANGDQGTLNAWSLWIDVVPPGLGKVEFDQNLYGAGDTVNFTVEDPNAVAPVDVEVTSGAGDIEVVTLTDNGDGTHSGSIVTATGAAAADGTLQVSLRDSISISYFDADDGQGSSGTRTDDAVIENRIEYPSVDIPVDIIDQTTVTSIIEITDAGTIADLDVSLDITHTWDSDLDVTLTSPAGTVVELFTDVGGSGDNFIGTFLDDEAGTAITNGGAPFTGRFTPEGFLGDFDNESITGTWTLSIFDDANGDSGTLDAWSLWIDVIPAVVDMDMVSPGTVNEGDDGNTDAAFEITLSEAFGETITVDYATTVTGYADPATPGVDFVEVMGTATFNPGDTSVIVNVPIIGERYTEIPEQFGLELSNISGDHNLLTTVGDATIGDDDGFEFGTPIDFVTETSPVDVNSVGFLTQDYSAGLGMGWSNTVALNTFELALGNDLNRDLAVMRGGTFSIDVANGDYDVTVYFGQNRRRDPITLTFEGGTPNEELLNLGPSVTRTYTVNVADGQLTMDFSGNPGLDRRIRIAGIEVNEVSNKGDNGSGDKKDSGDFGALRWSGLQLSSTAASNYDLSDSLLSTSKETSSLAGSIKSDVTTDTIFEDFGSEDSKSTDLDDLFAQFA